MKLIFAGTPSNAALALELLSEKHEIALVITRPDAEVGRKRVLTPSPVAQVAQRLDLPILKCAKLSDSDVEQIAKVKADLAIVVAYGSLIPQTALDLMPWWNLHFSLLPMWRGATPLQHSILHGGPYGVTLFELDRGLDTGPIVSQLPVDLDENTTTGEALIDFTKAGVALVLEALKSRPKLIQQIGESSHAPKISRLDARLDLGRTANQIHREVMAFNPEPMAWSELSGQPIRIIRTKSLGSTDWTTGEHRPGHVSLSGEKVLLECGGGTQVELLVVQPAGKQQMSAGDWYRGQSAEVHFV